MLQLHTLPKMNRMTILLYYYQTVLAEFILVLLIIFFVPVSVFLRGSGS